MGGRGRKSEEGKVVEREREVKRETLAGSYEKGVGASDSAMASFRTPRFAKLVLSLALEEGDSRGIYCSDRLPAFSEPPSQQDASLKGASSVCVS